MLSFVAIFVDFFDFILRFRAARGVLRSSTLGFSVAIPVRWSLAVIAKL